MNLLNLIKKHLLPPNCVICGIKTNEYSLCHDCYQRLPWIKHACYTCSHPIETHHLLCGECISNLPIYERTISLFEYENPIITFIHQLKFHNQLFYAKLLGELLSSKIQSEQIALPEIILPVPLHYKRLRERGFNQALEIARPIAKKLKLKIDYKSLIKKHETKAQALIPANQRITNLKDSFVIDPKFKARHVAIIDDVVTTGQTVSEISKTLLVHGV
ncbi:MAG: ComF family protein, partial [Gammaproteobacteria bacterium]